MNMQSEPLRLPAWAVAVLLVVGPPVAAVLLGAEWQEAVATAILGLVASGGVIGATETARAFVDSPATRQAKEAPDASHVDEDQVAPHGQNPELIDPGDLR